MENVLFPLVEMIPEDHGTLTPLMMSIPKTVSKNLSVSQCLMWQLITAHDFLIQVWPQIFLELASPLERLIHHCAATAIQTSKPVKPAEAETISQGERSLGFMVSGASRKLATKAGNRLGVTSQLQEHGLPYFDPDIFNIEKAEINMQRWPLDMDGRYLLSFPTTVEHVFDLQTANRVRAAALVDLHLLAAGTSKYSLGPANAKLFVQDFVNAWCSENRAGMIQFSEKRIALKNKEVTQRPAGEARDDALVLLETMEEGLKDWSELPGNQQLLYEYVLPQSDKPL